MSIKKFFGGRSRKPLLFFIDVCCFLIIDVMYFVATKLFETSPDFYFDEYLINSVILFLAMFGMRLLLRIYRNVWRYTSTKAYFNLVLADFFGGVLALLISRRIGHYTGLWHFLVVASLTALMTLSSRFTYRLIYKRRIIKEMRRKTVNVAIIGAGQCGINLVNDLTYNQSSLYNPVFFIDNDTAKVGSKICSLPVYREDEKIFEKIVEEDISEIFVALSNLGSEVAMHIYEYYGKTGCKIKVYDTPVHEGLERSPDNKRMVRDFSIEDLLFRKPISVNDSEAFGYYKDKTVLVTGGGGSIGSELCRQIAKCAPKHLVIFDIYENNAYDIQQELRLLYGDKLSLSVEIGSVRDRERLECVFMNYRPEVVFHAAAHKHVPLMEQSACEAIKNNVMGTYNTADMAEKYGTSKFILISTDKAVNPTNVMGASKRICEMVIQCRTDSSTSFAAVRFGNVLGSNGSVIPLFKRQIANGGPVTITDKRIIRYFMTIPEASSLVIQAGAMAKKGELYVLDMGKPVKIYDLARNMIRLSGFIPDVDIKIKEIGLRPGEKLYEELLMKTETLDKTENNMIFIERDTPLTREMVQQKLEILMSAVEASKYEVGSGKVKEAIIKTVPTFHEPEELNKKAEQTKEFKDSAEN